MQRIPYSVILEQKHSKQTHGVLLLFPQHKSEGPHTTQFSKINYMMGLTQHVTYKMLADQLV